MRKSLISLLLLVSLFSLTGCDEDNKEYQFGVPTTYGTQLEESYIEEIGDVIEGFSDYFISFYVDDLFMTEDYYLFFCENIDYTIEYGKNDVIFMFDKQFRLLHTFEFGTKPSFIEEVEGGVIVRTFGMLHEYYLISYSGESTYLGKDISILPGTSTIAVESRYSDVPSRIISIEAGEINELATFDNVVYFNPQRDGLFMMTTRNDDYSIYTLHTVKPDGEILFSREMSNRYDTTYSGFYEFYGETLEIYDHLGEEVYKHTFDGDIRHAFVTGEKTMIIEMEEGNNFILFNDFELVEQTGFNVNNVLYDTTEYTIAAKTNDDGNWYLTKVSRDFQSIIWQFEEQYEHSDITVTDELIYLNNDTEILVYDHDKVLVDTLPFGGKMISDNSGYLVFNKEERTLISYDKDYNILFQYIKIDYVDSNIEDELITIRYRTEDGDYYTGMGLFMFNIHHSLLFNVYEENHNSFYISEINDLIYIGDNDLQTNDFGRIHVYNDEYLEVETYILLGRATDDVGTYILYLNENTLYKIYLD